MNDFVSAFRHGYRFCVCRQYKLVWIVILILTLLSIIPLCSSDDTDKSGVHDEANRKDSDETASQDGYKKVNSTQILEYYRKSLGEKRKEHLSVIKKMFKKMTYDKQHVMLKELFGKVFKALMENRQKLIQLGYTPGDSFPIETATREALMVVVETTLFVGDVVLRAPDISHNLFQKHYDWELAIKGSVSFVNETGILVGDQKELMYLMSQELGIFERDPTYVNPYKASNQMKQDYPPETQHERKKKERKKLKRGPKLSTRTDL